MRTTNSLKPRFSSRSKSVRLFVAFAFCATSFWTLGCKTTNGKSCCGLGSNDPEKLATINEPDSISSDSVSRGQTGAAIAPSETSKERLDKTFSSVQPDVPQATAPDSESFEGAENKGAGNEGAGSFAANESSSTSLEAESLNSLNYVPTTNNPTNESNLPNVTPAPSASVQPPTEICDAPSAREEAESQESRSTPQYLSVAPSVVQEKADEIAEHTAQSASELRSNLDSKLEEISQEANARAADAALTPPVEASSEAATSPFANEQTEAEDATSPSTPNAVSSEQRIEESSNLTNEGEASQAPETRSIDNPTLDTSVPVTFKPTAASRVVEIQTTGASTVLNSRAGVAQRSAKRVPSKVGLTAAGTPVGKPIDASKDVSRLTRIRPR